MTSTNPPAADQVAVAGNLVWTEQWLGHNLDPTARPPARNVTTVVTTRYWVDSIHEIVPHPEPDYFARRADLFTRYTLPSMLNQTTPPDAWLVLFSPWVADQPGVAEIMWQLEQIPFAHLVAIPEHRAFSSISRDWITGYMRTRPGHWLASARLDNDDMLAPDYVDALTKWVAAARPEIPSTVVFPIGIQHDHGPGPGDAGVRSRLFVSPVNHFTAAISAPELTPVFDPYLINHTEIYRTDDLPQTQTVYQLATRYPMWGEVLHPDNAANHHQPGPRLDPGWPWLTTPTPTTPISRQEATA